MNLNKQYANISKADARSKVILKRKFDSDIQKMDDLIKELFDLGELDCKIPSIEELYKSL